MQLRQRFIARTAAIGLAALLVALTCLTGTAMASTAYSAGGIAAADDGATLQTTASAKKTVYVLTKMTDKAGSDTTATNITYTKKGLVASKKTTAKSAGYTYKTSAKYTYTSKNAMKTMKAYSGNSQTEATTYKVDKKQRVIQATRRQDSSEDYDENTKYTYNKNGTLKKTVVTREFLGPRTVTFTFNKKGSLTKVVDNDAGDKSTRKYSYDKNGCKTKYVYNGKTLYTYKNQYNKSKCLTKMIATNAKDKQEFTVTYKYKKLSVPKAVAPMVEAQQRSLLLDQAGDTLPLESAHM